MVKNNVYYEWFASITVPNPDQVGYWVDLGADSKGRIIKVYNRDIEKWVVLFDVSKDDYVPPFIGSNGNWWVDNRDTGVKATAETPYIGKNDHWFTYDPINKVYVDTGIEARGLSAYDIAVKLGFEGSEQDWIDSLSKASEDAAVAALDAANKANEAADKANQAVEEIEGIVDDAIAATDKAEEIASNPPKIVDNDWWIYDYDTKQYVNTGIAAIGDAFTYKKEYPSVEAMEADWGTADVKLGEYVLINTNDVEDPDDAKVYLKTQNGWKFIVDLSGMQGIQGWSAYEVAVQHGFVGTEAEWVQSLKQPALDAAAEALEAKAQVEATEQAVKQAESLRVTAEQGRVANERTRTIDENTRRANESARQTWETQRREAEDTRIAAEISRKSEEEIRKTNEANRVSAESSRASAETLRASAEAERNTNEQKRIEEETKRISSEEGRVAAETERVDNEDARIAAETTRDTAEQERIANEATRQANEAIRETQEAAREKNTADAITAVNEAKTAAQQATTNATTAANNANTQANRAKEYADNPPKVGEDGYWYLWDEVDDVYVNTGWPSSGIILKGSLDSPEDLDTIVDPQLSDSYIVGTDLYFWNGTEWVNMGRFQGPQGEPGKDAELSKAAIEAVLVGEVTTHTHDTRYYTKEQTDANIKVVSDDLANNYYNKSQVDSKFTSVYIFKGSVDSIEDLPAEGNVIGDVWNVRKSDTNYAWTSEGWDALGGTAELASATANGLMSAADKTKLDGLSNYDDSTITQDITNIKANKLETIEVTGTGNVITAATKSGTKIAFAKGITAMTQDASDARYVKKAGDTMTGALNITAAGYNTEVSLDGLKLETSKTSANAKGLFFRNFDKTGYIGGIGMFSTGNGSIYRAYNAYVGWDNSPWDSANNLTVSKDAFTYKNNKVWHAGNDGTGSGLDADLLDGYHAGYKNGNLALYINFPKITDLISQGLLRSDYETVGYPTEDFLIALCKWAINNYTGETSHVLLQGEITPAVSGWCVLNLYANDGKDNTTGLPKYCSGQVNLINKSSILFGSYNGTWYYKTLVDTSNLEDTLAYWYENDENNSSTTCATGGNRNVIESLRSKFKRCIAMPSGDDAALISYCNEEDSSKWPDSTNITIMNNHQNRMVYFPKYYHKTIERSPGIWRTYISEQQIDSNYIEEPEMLLASFEGSINIEGMLISTASQTSAASKTMAEFVTAAKTHGSLWGIGDYRSHATIARMFCAYYKTTNISTSNSAIPCSGGTKRYDYGKTGGTIALGNKDGKAAVVEDTGYYSTNFLGLEDCYYSKWEFVQGINILKGKYVVYDGGSFPDKDVAELEAAGATNIRVVGYEPNPAATEGYNGWTKAVAQGKYGDVVPTAHGGSETTYYSDYSWFNPTGNRIFLRSGGSDNGSQCGVFLANASSASWGSWTIVGARLAFYGKIVVVDSDTFKKMQA
jgi:hypothetical protein